MDLGDGWEPLSKFLGVPAPSDPFPRANDAKAADAYATKVILKAFGVWLGILLGLGVTTYGAVGLFSKYT
jgi:hypothetical protein